MTTRGINNNYLVLLFSEESNTFLGDLHRVSLFLVSKEWALDLCGVHLELLEGTGSKRVSTYETDAPPFLHIVKCKLRTGGSLTGSLKTNKHDDVALASLVLNRLVSS